MAKKALKAGEQINDARAIIGALRALAVTEIWRGNYEQAQEMALRILEMAKAIDEPRGIGAGYNYLGRIALFQNHYGQAQAYFEKWLTISNTETKNARDIIAALYWLGVLHFEQQDYAKAEKLFKQALEKGQQIGWQRAISYSSNYLGDLARERGNYEEANRFYERASIIAERFNDQRRLAHLKHSRALLECKRGNVEHALALTREANDRFQRLGMRKEIEEARELVERLKREMTKGVKGAKEVR